MAANYKTYKRERYLFFWLSILVYFVPYIVVTACLLPLMKTSTGQKVGIGMAVIFINALPCLAGIFHAFHAHYPFFNLVPFVYLGVREFFKMDIFQHYEGIFAWIEFTVALGIIAYCILWHFHRKYKRKAQTVNDVLRSGILQSMTEAKHD